MRIKIYHETHYKYDAKPSYLVQRLHLKPADFISQKAVNWKITTPGIEHGLVYVDGFGNWIHLITAQNLGFENVILAEGEIQMGSGSNNGTIYSDELSSLIRELDKDKEVKAVVLRIDSPGGSALASDVIWRSLEYLKKHKKVVASFSDVAASGGYYIAAGADYIYAEPTTITGSIGVFGMLFNAEKFFDNKLGITFDGVKTHSSADIMSNSRTLTEFEKNRIQEEVTDIYGTFLGVVQQGRKKFEDKEAVREVAEGRVWLGARAMEIGLVDGMGSLDAAIVKAASLAGLKSYDVILYPDEKRWIDKVMDSLSGASIVPTWLQKIFIRDPKQEIFWARWPFDVKL